MKFGFSKLLLLFTVVPFIEFTLLLKLAEVTSAMTTLGIILATGVIGAYFAKDQGRRVITKIQNELNNGRMPANEMIHGLCVLIGGVLLVTPGILTDLFGFSLIFPLTRTLYISTIKDYMMRNFRMSHVHVYTPNGSDFTNYTEYREV